MQALPVLRHLKRHFPQSEIYWWIETGLAPLLEDDTDLAGIIRFDRRRWAEPRNWARLWRDLRWMRQQAFDWVIDLQCLARSGAFAWLANGQLLIGLDEPREGARGYYDLVKYSVLTPLYWLMMSWGAYKAAAQLITRPHYWEKTDHGTMGGAG